MSEIFMNDDSIVSVVISVLRYEVTFPLEYNVSVSQQRITDVVNDKSSNYLFDRSQ